MYYRIQEGVFNSDTGKLADLAEGSPEVVSLHVGDVLADFAFCRAQYERRIGQTRAAKLAELMSAYDAAFAPVDAVYPAKERETWPVQLEEAAAVLANPSAETPMLSIMVAARGKGETPADLARIVMENNALYRQLAGALTGQQQRMYAEIAALESVEALQGYEVAFAMPQGLNYPGA